MVSPYSVGCGKYGDNPFDHKTPQGGGPEVKYWHFGLVSWGKAPWRKKGRGRGGGIDGVPMSRRDGTFIGTLIFFVGTPPVHSYAHLIAKKKTFCCPPPPHYGPMGAGGGVGAGTVGVPICSRHGTCMGTLSFSAEALLNRVICKKHRKRL